MELKFLVFVCLVFFAVLECIETRQFSGQYVRSSGGGGSRTSAAYRIHRPFKPRPRPVPHPRPRPVPHPGPRPRPHPMPHPRPYPAPWPRPVTTKRPPRPTKGPHTRPITTAPRPKTTESPTRTFPTVPTPRHTQGIYHPVHTTPTPPHVQGNGSSGVHPPGPKGTDQTAPTHPTPLPYHNREFSNQRNYSVGTGISPAAPGWNISVSNSKPPGTLPPAPIQPTHYPTQATHTAFLNSSYPSHNSTNGRINPVETHVIHHPPSNPVQTVVVVSGQTGYQRTPEDILNEVRIRQGVNAVVHSILSPTHHHHHHSDKPKNNAAPPQNASNVTNVQITNINYYEQNPGSTGNVGEGSNPAPNGGSNYPNSGNSGNYPNASSPGDSQISTNGQSHPNQNNGSGQVNNGYITIFDDELSNITEKLFSLDENNASRFISLNLQKQVEANNTSNITDQSPQPLFSIQPEAYSIPTVRAIRTVYEGAASGENKTREDSRREEALLVDLILKTNVMTAAMNFLVQKGLIENDYYVQRNMMENLWFKTYDESSSGFKRIFQGEVFQGFLWGIQDWIAFDIYEKSGRANYFSYVTKTDLGKSSPNTAILKINFQMNENTKTGTALFVGISPELQMALYTICYHTRRDNYCDVSLGQTPVRIYTHADRYFGNDLINIAFPIL